MREVRRMIVVSIAVAWFVSPMAANAQVACGDTIPARTKVTLLADIGLCTASTSFSALTIEGGATLDLGGFTVSCDSNDRPNGITLVGKGAKLRNGAVSNCADNIVLAGEGRHKVDTVSSTLSAGSAFSVLSDGNRIQRAFATNSTEGFRVTGDNNILKDTSTARTVLGGYLVTGNRNKLTNVISAASSGDGIRLFGNENKISGGASTDSGPPGTSTSNGLEIFGERNQVSNLRTDGNQGSGIIVNLSATETKVQRCVSFSNSAVDMGDFADACGSNQWKRNVFGRSSAAAVISPDCIR